MIDGESLWKLNFSKHSSRFFGNLFYLELKGEPKSKLRISDAEIKNIRVEAEKQMEAVRRVRFRVPIAVSIDVFSSVCPPIHVIPKNYLDILQGIVFENDRQVEYLFIRLFRGKEENPKILFRFYPMSSARADLRLANEIAEYLHDRNSLFEGYEMEEDDDLFFIKSSDPLLRRLGESARQRRFLNEEILSPYEMQCLFSRPPKKTKRGDILSISRAKIHNLIYSGRVDLSKALLSSKGRIQIFSLPGRLYRVEKFVSDIKARAQWFTNANNLSPTYHSIGLEVIYSPSAGGYESDVDNIMRRVTSAFDGAFKWARDFQEGIKVYEIIKVNSDRADAKGQIAIGLCDADKKESIFENTHRFIDDRYGKVMDDLW